MNLDINEISNTKFEFLSNTCTTVENQFIYHQKVLFFLKKSELPINLCFK